MDVENEQMKVAMKQFKRLQTLKKNLEDNKLSNRNDVQVLRKKINRLNQDLMFSKQDMEKAKNAYDEAKNIYDKKTEEHKQYVEHLTIITENHKKEQQVKLLKLLEAMKMPVNMPQQQADNK